VQVALTFDAEHPDHPAGPPEQCGRILDALAGAGARATFFVQGRWAQARPAEARRIADEGHLVGLHCNSHVPYPWLSAEGVAADLDAGRRAVRAACGVDPAPWFRFPFGRGARDAALGGLVRAAGFANVHWSVDPRDWDPCTRAGDLAGAVCAAARADAVSVVLLHTWPAVTAAALPALLDRLADLGAALVTAAELDPPQVAALAATPERGPAPCGTH
jgi:peptidoglycan/xylan/chitin deacetylase (PgdA/CDA1 family)